MTIRLSPVLLVAASAVIGAAVIGALLQQAPEIARYLKAEGM